MEEGRLKKERSGERLNGGRQKNEGGGGKGLRVKTDGESRN